MAKAQKLIDGLRFQDGEVALRGDLAKLNLPPDLRFLGPDDAQTVIERLWGNPHSASKPLGMLVPANVPLATPAAWAVIVTYDEDGYVKDDDAAKLDYAAVLRDMQADTKESNKLRKKDGYPTVELIGWAAPPRYDAAAKKMYWAKELRFEGEDESTLNYNIRVLGRRGVLVLNAVASISQLKEIEAATPILLGSVDFQEGHRYSDFKPGTDKVATYGLAALVAGGVLAKTGMLKVLIGAVLAAKKFIIIGLVAIGSFIKRFITGNKQPPPA